LKGSLPKPGKIIHWNPGILHPLRKGMKHLLSWFSDASMKTSSSNNTKSSGYTTCELKMPSMQHYRTNENKTNNVRKFFKNQDK